MRIDDIEELKSPDKDLKIRQALNVLVIGQPQLTPAPSGASGSGCADLLQLEQLLSLRALG